MKALFYPGQGQPVVVQEMPDPDPGEGEVILKVHSCGICGTDLSMTKGEAWDFGPGQLGHEYAGEIVAIGKGVGGLKMGQKLSVLPSGACGQCENCRNGGNHILCANAASFMHGFAEYARVGAYAGIPLPDTLSMADGALVEPLAVSLYGVRQSRIQPGDNVLILGGGTVALYAIYWARRLGARRIVAMSRSDRRRDLCLQMGADGFVHYGENEVGEVIEALGGSPDIVYECVGSEGMLTKSVMHVKAYGRIVSLGFCTHMDPVMPAMASYKCATMQFLVGYTLRDFLYIADQLDRDRVYGGGHADPKAILTSSVPLVDMVATFESLRGPNNETKVHVRCSDH